ncbi:MAG: hypothetical protein ACRDHD_03470 [Candidatus Limnocylindria bacterium]
MRRSRRRTIELLRELELLGLITRRQPNRSAGERSCRYTVRAGRSARTVGALAPSEPSDPAPGEFSDGEGRSPRGEGRSPRGVTVGAVRPERSVNRHREASRESPSRPRARRAPRSSIEESDPSAGRPMGDRDERAAAAAARRRVRQQLAEQGLAGAVNSLERPA